MSKLPDYRALVLIVASPDSIGIQDGRSQRKRSPDRSGPTKQSWRVTNAQKRPERTRAHDYERNE